MHCLKHNAPLTTVLFCYDPFSFDRASLVLRGYESMAERVFSKPYGFYDWSLA